MADTYQGDPYREVEMYLEQAQEEIGRAFADLARYEFRFDSGSPISPVGISSNGGSHSSPVAFKVNVGDNGMIDKSKLCRAAGGNATVTSTLMEDLSTPPSGDLEQLSAWADTFVQEVNLEWESAGPWETTDNVVREDEGENVYNKFRSLPTNARVKSQKTISTSFRSSATAKRNRRQCSARKLWSWPPGLEVDLDTGKITIYPLRVKDAEVQTGFEAAIGGERASFQISENVDTILTTSRREETNLVKNEEISNSLAHQNEDDEVNTGENEPREREDEDSGARLFESSSNWIFKNMLSREANGASSIDRCGSSSSSSSDCDSSVVASGVEDTTRELSETLFNDDCVDHEDGISDVSSDNEEEENRLIGGTNSFATSSNGAVSFTVSWLAVEDDSDHLENKELPKLTSKNLLEANYGGTDGTPQKSPSSTLSSVSRHELETFLQKVASSVYQPPPEGTAGLSDSPQQDAVTQTSPNLSRSSSFTWVTDCDCSDLSPRPLTEPSRDSLPSFSDCPTSDSRDTSSTASSSSFTEKDLKSSSSSRTCSPRNRKPTPRIQPWFDSSLSLSDASDLNSDPGGQFDFEPSNGHSPRGEHDSGGSDPTSSRKFSGKWLRLAEAQALSPEFKSSSAPLVMGKSGNSPTDKVGPDFDLKVLMSGQRSQSARQLTELEAIEACTWLRAAGFPQYAQMYEDNLFPIDITGVRKDHEFLDSDAIRSLFRRLNTLNKCARLKSDGFPRKSVDESDEEDHCALSENWQFQRSSRRWSRILPLSPSGFNTSGGPASPKAVCGSPKFLSPNSANLNNFNHNHTSPSHDNSRDSVFLDDPLLQSSPESLRKAEFFITMGLPMEEDFANYLGGGLRIPPGSPVPGSIMDRSEHSSLRRSGSERLKDSARALLRRVESLKGKRKKKNREVVIIGGPEGDTSATMVTSTKSEVIDSNGIEIGVESDTSLTGTPQIKHSRKGWPFPDDTSAHSDSECPIQLTVEVPTGNDHLIKRRNGSVSSLDDVSPGSQESARSRRAGQRNSQWLGMSEMVRSPGDRRSLYDNVPPGSAKSSVETTPDLSLPSYTRSGSCKDSEHDSAVYNHVGSSDPDTPGSQEDMDISGITSERRDSGVGSSLTRQSGSPVIQPRWHCFTSTTLQLPAPRSGVAQHVLVNSLSAPQLMVLRKFSLLKLTALMEKYSPSNRAGWNWGVPKFIRRIRTPDYKDKLVFGVPLILVVQRTGQPLPPSIQIAIEFIRKNGLDATGVFRKSGVRSRIQKLRNLSESNPDGVSFEGQQVYDVADMIKQYFRELPDALLTNKLSETFISIFQHIPAELRLEATQAAILLMPDENREALQSLLCFLDEVCEHSEENQMTATNLAVCFAPSLFHLNVPRSASASPRRRKTVGVPDQKDLNENRAAHECLTTMISNYKRLFLVPEDTMLQCRLLTVEPCEPVNLVDLIKNEGVGRGVLQDGWKAYMDGCIEGLLKEAREKFKGWVPLPSVDGVEVAYKKVGDGHPLKLWKVSVEIEAPPVELLNRVLRERHIWDEKLLKWKVVVKLDKHAEIYQHSSGTITPHPPRDYSVLRMWRIDPKKGTTCILVETSVEHADAVVPSNAIRGLVLASRFLIEPCGSGKSKVTHITRIDTRGRAPEWYNKVYGQYCATLLVKLRDSFKKAAAGPETKV